MSEHEIEWSSEGAAAPKKKRGIPTWLWAGCGVGCLLVVLVLVLGGLFVGSCIQDMADPEVQWPRLQEVLPFDERPTQLEMTAGIDFPVIDIDQWVLMDFDRGLQATIMRYGPSMRADMAELMEPDPKGAPFGIGAPKEGVKFDLEVQGRTVQALRHTGVKANPAGPGVRVLIEFDDDSIYIEIVRMVGHGSTALTDEDVAELLSPFDIWRGR